MVLTIVIAVVISIMVAISIIVVSGGESHSAKHFTGFSGTKRHEGLCCRQRGSVQLVGDLHQSVGVRSLVATPADG
jgi:hypothetical protein